MNTKTLVLITSFCLSSIVHGAVGLQNNHPTTGTDSDTISYPSSGLNTAPTMNTGTESIVDQHPPIPNEKPVPIKVLPPTAHPGYNVNP